LDRELDDILAVEINGIGRKGRACRVLDALIDGKNREVTRPIQTAMIEERLEIAQNRRFAVAPQPDAADKIGARQVELIFRDRFAPVLEQVTGAVTEDFFNPGNRAKRSRKISSTCRAPILSAAS